MTLYIQPLIELAQNGPGQRKARVYTYLAEPERFANWDLICFSVELKFIPIASINSDYFKNFITS